MKKLILIFPLLLLSITMSAQRDPQWLMPLYFRDANGDRDTVYFGYDPEASTFGDDSYLGEEWMIIDTSKFNVFLFQYPNCTGGDCQLYTNNVKKTDIRNAFLGTSIGFCKGKLPFTMKWIDSLLYAPSCPFPDISPRPRARIDLTCSNYDPGYYYSCNPADGPPFSLTDYPTPDIIYPITDSMVFDGSGLYPPAEVLLHLTLNLVAHDEGYVLLRERKETVVRVFPNPFLDNVNIRFTRMEDYLISIVSLAGEVLSSTNGYGNEASVYTGYLNKGLYLIVIKTKSDLNIQKISKSE